MLRSVLIAGAAGLALTACAQPQPPRTALYAEGPVSVIRTRDGDRIMVIRSGDWRDHYLSRHDAERIRREAQGHARAAEIEARAHARAAERHAREAMWLAELARPSPPDMARIRAEASAARAAGEAARRAGDEARRQVEAMRPQIEAIRRDAERLRQQCLRGEIACQIIETD